MTTTTQPSELERYRMRRCRQARDRRMLNNLPLAHRLATSQGAGAMSADERLGQAMVGLVEAVDRFEALDLNIRFSAFAEPCITDALARTRDAEEVEAAQAKVAEAISSQGRVQELARFLDVPITALVGGLMDANQRERITREQHLRGAA